MSKREMIEENALEGIAGGRVTYTYNKHDKGKCGINGNYDYSFDDVYAFLGKVGECQRAGMVDTEIIDALLDAGIIW